MKYSNGCVFLGGLRKKDWNFEDKDYGFVGKIKGSLCWRAVVLCNNRKEKQKAKKGRKLEKDGSRKVKRKQCIGD